MTTIVLVAKEATPGRVKTRLHPPLSLAEAAELASAAIADTLEALSAISATRRILLFDGVNPPPNTEDYEVVAQESGGLDVRLGALFDAVDGPTLLVGMDTPQLTPAHLSPAFPNWSGDVDAWFGPANDGGFWAIGMRKPSGDLIRGIRMSRSDTGACQLERLARAGLSVGMLATLTDVDTMREAREVATLAPLTTFAQTLRKFTIDAPFDVSELSAMSRKTQQTRRE